MPSMDSLQPDAELLEGFDQIKIFGGRDFIRSQQLAWDEAEQMREDPVMMAWFDRDAKACFPSATCVGDSGPGWLFYARACGSDLAVSVDDDRYVFLFRNRPQ